MILIREVADAPVIMGISNPRDIPLGTLSQMGTFLVHRLINEQDKKAVESAASAANRNILSFLPIWGEGEALIVGVDFPIPIIVKINAPTIKASLSSKIGRKENISLCCGRCSTFNCLFILLINIRINHIYGLLLIGISSTLSIYFLKRDIIMWKFTKSVVHLLLNIFINFCMNSLQVCIDIYRRNSTNEL